MDQRTSPLVGEAGQSRDR